MTKPVITTVSNGPLRVEGAISIRSMTPVESEKGEPMTWDPGLVSTADGPRLCRCGASNSKPFCDGSHADHDWDGAGDQAPLDTFSERAERIEGEQLALLDDESLCVHAGFCGTERTSVWELMESSDDTEARAQVIRMVEKCPSGRLVNVIEEHEIEPSLPVEVGVVPGGPLWVTGGAVVVDSNGAELESRNRVTLCRCGASSQKPLCDGSHKDIDFGEE